MKLQSLRHRLLLIAAMLLAVPALAQDAATGAIAGTVTDSSGAVIANAEVKVISPDTNAVRYARTNPHGVFHVPLLLPGSYSVTVSAAGFANHSFPETLVTVSETSSLNVILSIQQVFTNVEIKSGGEIAQLESSSLGRAANERDVAALPLANRNYTQILGLSPGVVVSIPNAAELGSGTQNVTSNGAKTTANNIQFNAVDAKNLGYNSAANDAEEIGTGIPTPDSIQEFMVQTANFDAAYGRGSGANIDLVSKAGTNQFHGSAWEFLRNNIFHGNDFLL